MKILARSLAAACAAAFLGGCLGGTGTDTENGITANETNKVTLTGVSARVVDGDGKPMQGVQIALFDTAFRPDSGRAPIELLTDSDSLLSDSAGYVSLHLKAAGKFVIEGRSAGQTLFYDTLAVADLKTAAPFTFRAREIKAFKGRVRLASGMHVDSGAVFIRGTRCFAKLDDSGGYDLGSLPADVGRMAVGARFASSPTAVKQVSITMPVDTGPAKPTYVCKEVPKDSAARITAPTAAHTPGVMSEAIAPAKLDTGVVNPALKACDSLPKGAVVSVVGGAPGTAKTDSSNVLVVGNSGPSFIGTTDYSVAIPLNGCAVATGAEQTSYNVSLMPAASGGDLYVRDVADKCLAH